MFYVRSRRGRRGRDRRVVGFTTTCAISNPAQARCTQYNIM